MKIVAEAVAFTGMAVALHLGGLALATFPSGASDATGAGGADLVTLRGADSTLAATIARWAQAPKAQEQGAVLARVPAVRVAAAPIPSADAALPTAVAAPALELPDMEIPLLPRQAPPPPPPPPDVALLRDVVAPALISEPPTVPAEDAASKHPTTPAPLAGTKPGDQPAKMPPAPAPPLAPVAPAPVLRAAGQGGGALAGISGQAAAPSLSTGNRNGLLAAWGARIRMAVERQKHYPRAAGGATGKAVVEIRVVSDGHVRQSFLRKSAGHPALDHAALAAVRAVGRFPAAPEGLDPGPHEFSFQMSFAP